MINKITAICFCFLIGFGTAQANENIDTTPDINGWGFDISFGNQSYMEFATRISVVTPHMFSLFKDLKWRMTADFIGRELQGASDETIGEFGISLESNSSIYKDIVYSYTKWGVSVLNVDDVIYDDTIISVPLSFGLQVVTRNTEKMVMSYFIDYRFSLFNTYDEDDASAALAKEVLFSGTTSFGLRFIF